MPTIYREGKLAGLNKSISAVGQFALQKQLLERQRQQELQDAVKKAVISSVLSGKGKFKGGANIQDIISGGQLPDLNQFQPINTPTTSISISEIPYSERLKAREIGARTPQEWNKLGMATKTGGWFGNWGPGSKLTLSPEAQSAQTEAAGILKNPYRTTKRLGYRGGDIMDTTGMNVTADTNGLPDPSEYDEGTIIEDDTGNQYKLTQGQWVQL